jgi:hypothetical protein
VCIAARSSVFIEDYEWYRRRSERRGPRQSRERERESNKIDLLQRSYVHASNMGSKLMPLPRLPVVLEYATRPRAKRVSQNMGSKLLSTRTKQISL